MRGPKGNLLTGLVVIVSGLSLAEAAGDVEIFDLGPNLNIFQYTVMMTMVLAGLVAFDIGLETLEHHILHHQRRFHKRLFEKAVKEMMILGFVSFVMFILKDQGVVDDSTEEFSNTFDFVNLFLFFVGISFVIAAFILAMFTSPLKSRWDAYSMASLEDLLNSHACIVSKPWAWYAVRLPRLFRVLRQAQVIEYHLFRSVFLRLNRKLLTPAFDFSKYASAIVDEIIIQNFDVGWESWLLTIIVLFFTLPISSDDNGSLQVTSYGAIVFGFCVLVMECLVAMYMYAAFYRVRARMGVVGGFKGVGKAMEQLWVKPQHHMDQETSAIDVKDLLMAAPGRAPTLAELTSQVAGSSQGFSQAQANFRLKKDNSRSSARTSKSGSEEGSVEGPELDTDGRLHPCSENGNTCSGCETCDPMWLPEGAVQTCDMNGDPFVFLRLRPPQWVIDRLPKSLKGIHIKVGSYRWFRSLFGMTILQKCYYTAFYFSYAIGRATETSTLEAVAWIVFTPIPLLLCMLPLSKLTLPTYSQLACLQGEIVWELVSEIEEKHEMAERAREKVVQKLQEALKARAARLEASIKYEQLKTGGISASSPRSKAMQEWFSEWDTNKDNLISSQELSDGLQKLGVFLSDTELRELFRLADPDHSKQIDITEFRQFLANLQSLETDPFQLRREFVLRRLQSTRKKEEARLYRRAEEGLIVSTEDWQPTKLEAVGPMRTASASSLIGVHALQPRESDAPGSGVGVRGGVDRSGAWDLNDSGGQCLMHPEGSGPSTLDNVEAGQEGI